MILKLFEIFICITLGLLGVFIIAIMVKEMIKQLRK